MRLTPKHRSQTEAKVGYPTNFENGVLIVDVPDQDAGSKKRIRLIEADLRAQLGDIGVIRL